MIGAYSASISRHYDYGPEQAGVRQALALLADEIDRALALLGCRSIEELGIDCLLDSRAQP
jgi:isopentenyl diphosphate isomerase/L-lactate dehydrogenase-like FMN-dependent dehydrogenase